MIKKMIRMIRRIRMMIRGIDDSFTLWLFFTLCYGIDGLFVEKNDDSPLLCKSIWGKCEDLT